MGESRRGILECPLTKSRAVGLSRSNRLTCADPNAKLEGSHESISLQALIEGAIGMRIFTLISTATICWALSVALPSAQAENWPQWRGPKLDNISHETDLPISWSSTENVAWKIPMPGPGGASPVVWGDRIFVTAAAGDDLLLMCINTDGKELWRKTVGQGNKTARTDEGNSASPSPCTDGKYVWSYMGNGAIGCYDFDGNEIWNFNMQDRYGRFDIQFGMTSTPVLDGDRLYFQLIHGDGDAATQEALVVCLDKLTGKEIWKQPRPSEAVAENEHAYASPTIYRDDEREFLLTHGADLIVAHDLDTGKEIWRSGGLNPPDRYDRTLRLVASPTTAEGIIIAPSAKRSPLLALRPDGTGDITDSKTYRLWQHEKTPDVPTPVVYDGIVYLCMENGNLTTLDAKTGETFYKQKRTHRQRHRASPIYADGHIYLTARDGRITVVKAGPEFEVVSVNEMKDSLAASPAISNGTIYLRTFDNLWAIRKE